MSISKFLRFFNFHMVFCGPLNSGWFSRKWSLPLNFDHVTLDRLCKRRNLIAFVDFDETYHIALIFHPLLVTCLSSGSAFVIRRQFKPRIPSNWWPFLMLKYFFTLIFFCLLSEKFNQRAFIDFSCLPYKLQCFTSRTFVQFQLIFNAIQCVNGYYMLMHQIDTRTFICMCRAFCVNHLSLCWWSAEKHRIIYCISFDSSNLMFWLMSREKVANQVSVKLIGRKSTEWKMESEREIERKIVMCKFSIIGNNELCARNVAVSTNMKPKLPENHNSNRQLIVTQKRKAKAKHITSSSRHSII